MTRRGRLVCFAAALATGACLAALPMRMSALAVLGVWAGAVALAVLIAKGIDNAMWRHENHAMCSRILREAQHVLNERPLP